MLRSNQLSCPGLELELVVQHLHRAATISLGRDGISLPTSATPQLSERDAELLAKLEKVLRAAGLKLPVLSELAEAAGLDAAVIIKTVKLLTRSGRLVQVSQKYLALPEQLQQFAELAISLGEGNKVFSVADFKNKSAIGRNLAVAVLEYFDSIGLSARKGDGRILVNAGRLSSVLKT